MNSNTKRNAAARKPRAMARSVLGCAIATGLLLAASLPVAAQEYQEPGRIGDADSWRTDEFMADWGLAAIGAEYAYARGLTGQGIRLGVFDSGVALGHSEFAGKDSFGIIMADAGCTSEAVLGGAGACFYTNGGQASIDYLEYRDSDRALVQMLIDMGYLIPEANEIIESWSGFTYGTHGTHVAGTMAANRDGSEMHGVSHAATLSSARLFSNSYEDVASLLEGIFGVDFGGTRVSLGPGSEALADMYAQMQASGVRAINHSWGFATEPTTAGEMDALYNSDGAAEYFASYTGPSLQNGVIQVWAAGNDSGSIAGIHATLPRWVEEAEQYWVSVVNINQTGTIDASSSICGLSKDWCIAAPGTAITSSVVGGEVQGETLYDAAGNIIGFEVTERAPEYGYGDMTGTSMATPHVTGALALLMERYPYLGNTQVRDVMLTTAYDLGAAGVDEVYGWGLLDLAKAINGPGQIRVDTDVVMNQRAGGIKVWEGNAWDDWSNDIGGPGRLTKSGIGWLRLSGDNSFGGLTVSDGILELTGDNRLGDTVVEGGLLLVNGVHSDRLRVDAGGMVGGTGTLGDTAVAGTASPGNSIGTLHVAGDYTQLAGSFYDAELAADGTSDLIAVDGDARLDGTVRLLGTGGQYLPGQSYTLLTAGGLIEGGFAGVDSSAFSPFLGFALDAGAEAIGIDVVRGMAMADAAQTRNQRAVATSADAMAVTDPLFGPLVQLFPAQAVEAFDALSGEYHPGTRALLVEGSRHVRDAALDRALPLASEGASGDGVEAWVQGFGAGTSLDGDGNAAAVDGHGTGTLLGADLAFGAGWRIGAFAGVESTDVNLAGRASRGDVHSRHLGVYLGRRLDGGIDLGAGAGYARHEVDSERSVAFPGVEQYLSGEYDADTLQVFAEGGYRVERDGWDLQPYVRYAHVQVESDGFGETGGSAALTAAGAESRVNLFTAGVRFDVGVGGGSEAGNGLVWRSGLAYRHASGDRDSRSRMAWAGGQPFTVAGAPVADGAALVETGLAGWLAAGTLLELNYQGQFADGTDSHGLVARLSFRF